MCCNLQGHQQNLLKELALSREQLKRDLAAARQELELVAGAADAAKEEAVVQVNMLQRQLGAVQDKLALAEKVGTVGWCLHQVRRCMLSWCLSFARRPWVLITTGGRATLSILLCCSRLFRISGTHYQQNRPET